MSVILAMKTEYNNLNILQSVKSDEEIIDKEWKDINWKSIEYNIFKIQKRIFKAEKEGNYRKVNKLCRLLVNDKRSLLFAINLVTKKNKGKKTSGIDNKVFKHDYERMALFYKLKDYKISLHKPKPVQRIYIPKKNGKKRPLGIPTIKTLIFLVFNPLLFLLSLILLTSSRMTSYKEFKFPAWIKSNITTL